MCNIIFIFCMISCCTYVPLFCNLSTIFVQFIARTLSVAGGSNEAEDGLKVHLALAQLDPRMILSLMGVDPCCVHNMHLTFKG